MNSVRKYPIGIQDFEDLRTNGYLYVDKTAYVYYLATLGKPYFLGRPRRFGKSLLLSTLKAYFLGKKELFEGLAIAELEKDWVEYPVFYIDFNVGIYTDTQSLCNSIHTKLSRLEELWGKDVEEKDLASRFEGLIRRACEQTGRKVVVLIDEYDKPLLGTMDNLETNDQIRDVLKGFYGVLKSTDSCLRFVFLTGVTKFSKVSIFSDLNQLQDISLNERFAGICGISQAELEHYFEPDIRELANQRKMSYSEALAEMKNRYDGYHFAKESEDIYNPFSVLNTFGRMDFSNYWFQTGTPTFLAKALKNNGYDIRNFDNNVTISADSVSDYRIDNTDLIPLLYQSGYLTIKDYDSLFDEYILGFPNREVKYGFLQELLPAYAPKAGFNDDFSVIRFLKMLMSGDIEGFMTNLRAFYASIAYDMTKEKDERYYQFIFYLLFTLMGQFVQTEVKSALGRADAIVKTADSIFVFEFKMAGNGTAEEALAQIDDKSYSIPYIADGRKVVKIGAEFSAEDRGLKRWLIA